MTCMAKERLAWLVINNALQGDCLPVPDAPGISIRSVIERAPDSALRDFIGESTINVLAALNPELITHDDLVELAIGSADPVEMLRHAGSRTKLISLLPLAKANELAAKLGIRPKGAALYDSVLAAANMPGAEPLLWSFFGVVIYERAPGLEQSPEIEVQPSYGLFPYQRSVADRALAALRMHPHKVVVHMPTGAGKTRTAMRILGEIINQYPDRLVVWLANSAELLEQAADEFEKAWPAMGMASAKVYRFWGGDDSDLEETRTGLLVAGFGKLHALYKRDANMIMKLGDRAVLTVVDEAHQAIAPTYRTLITFLHEKRPGNMLMGLTATPGRTWSDIAADAELAKFFDNRKVTLEIEGYNNPVEFLIEQGYLARPTFRTLNVESGYRLSKSDIRALAEDQEIPPDVLEGLAEDDQRNIRIITTVEDLRQHHQRIIVFAATVAHAHLIASILQIRGSQAFVVTGYTNQTVRERVINKFKSSDPETLVMCNYGVLTTGFDAPKTSAALIARPTRSLVLYSQMVGRAIRGPRAGGNPTAEIITVVDLHLPGFGDIAEAFKNWEDVWYDGDKRS